MHLIARTQQHAQRRNQQVRCIARIPNKLSLHKC